MNAPAKLGLWTLLDMRKFFAASFTTAFLDLEWLQSAALFDESDPKAENRWRAEVQVKLENFSAECNDVGFIDLAARCDRLVSQIDSLPVITLCYMLRDVLPAIQFELMKHQYFLVPHERREYYHDQDKPLFGESVSIEFSSSAPEIAEAGRCFALARWTACVFHLMRAVEQALHKWVVSDLNVSLSTAPNLTNWQEIINQANKHLKALEQQSKTHQRQAELQYYGEVLTRFMGIKEAWRNHVSHGHKTYTEDEAASIWGQVKDFMQLIAKGVQS